MSTDPCTRRRHAGRATRRIAVGALAVAAVACQSNEPTGNGELPGPPALATPLVVERLPAATLVNEGYSGFGRAEVRLVRDQRALEAAWTQLFSARTDRPALPVIDFRREMVVVAAMGQRNSGGYGIAIDSAFANSGDGTTFAIRTRSPGASCFVTQALTAPADVARLPRRDGPVRVRQADVVTSCR